MIVASHAAARSSRVPLHAPEPDLAVSRVAAAIGEPARVRMLYSLMDGHARTSTELAVVAGVSPSTASVHLHRLQAERLVQVLIQGKHHYFSLRGPSVARALECLSVLAGSAPRKFVPSTPAYLRAARTCYDHIAGALGVALLNRFHSMGWIAAVPHRGVNSYDVTPRGAQAFASLGIDLAAARSLRRRFAYPCLDWSERQPHLAGALAAALLRVALRRNWLLQDLEGRALSITWRGRREFLARFGVHSS
jgi:DNA-binding transcriptional ArsR family regulator